MIVRPGLMEWFRRGDEDRILRFIVDCQSLGVTHVRTGLSWAEVLEPGGVEWYDYVLFTLSRHLNVLPVVSYTPPQLSMGWDKGDYRCNVPPADPNALTDFLTELVIPRWGSTFDTIELWNEPNNYSEYAAADYDPDWSRFAHMVGFAAYTLRAYGKATVMGGMTPIDPMWLQRMFQCGAAQYHTHVAVHAFPNAFRDGKEWHGWINALTPIQRVMHHYDHKGEIWVTETGFPSWEGALGMQTHFHAENVQMFRFQDVVSVLRDGMVKRLYWYSYQDLDPKYGTVAEATEGPGHRYEEEYHFGVFRTDGTEKLLYRRWKGIVNAELNDHERPSR